MQKTVLGLALLSLLLASPKYSFANSTNVSVKNNVSSSNSTTTTNSGKNTSQTNIIMETNGERQEYHGSDSNIHMESKDGNNKITVNGKETQKPTTAPTSMPTASPPPTVVPQPTASSSATVIINDEVLGESTEKENESMYQYIKNMLSSFFSKFF